MSNFAIRKLVLIYIHKKETKDSTGTNLHTQERNERFSTLQLYRHFSFLSCSGWRHLSCFCFCHVLVGAICHVLVFVMFWLAPNLSLPELVLVRACTHVFSDDVWRSKRGRPKKHGVTTSTSSTIMMNHCSFDGCVNRPTKHGNGQCRAHGGRTKCNHLGCDSFAKKGGMCGSHRPDKICCSTTGCTNLPQKNGVCKTHGGSQICKIHGCTERLFQSRMCYSHYSIVCTAINENAMVGEDDFSNLKEELNNFVVASHYLTIMYINDLPFGIIQEYVGMNNWEHALTLAVVCKSWRIAAEPHRAMIGIAPMEGGRQRKLNVTGFLSFWMNKSSLGLLREFMCHAD